LAGISSRSIVRYEAGEQAPKAPTLLKIAQQLGVSLAWLTGDTEDPYVDQGIRMREYQYFRGKPVVGDAGVNLFEISSPWVGLSPEVVEVLLRMIHAQNEKSGDEDVIPEACRRVLADLADRDARIEKGMAMLEEDARNRAQGPGPGLQEGGGQELQVA
jgi:transcriptional regulator with XRE-family HTH domain